MKLLACLSITLVPLIVATTTVIPASTPQGAFVIDPSFPNLGLELASLLLYAQSGLSCMWYHSILTKTISATSTDTTPNQYTINLLNNIFMRSGGHPIIRVGGTTG